MLIAATATPRLPPETEAQERANISNGRSRRLAALRIEPEMGMKPVGGDKYNNRWNK
jgi:hypothetical protein